MRSRTPVTPRHYTVPPDWHISLHQPSIAAFQCSNNQVPVGDTKLSTCKKNLYTFLIEGMHQDARVHTGRARKVAPPPYNILLITHQRFKLIYNILHECWTFTLTHFCQVILRCI